MPGAQQIARLAYSVNARFIERSCLSEQGGGQETAQWVRTLAAKVDNLTLIPRYHMVEGENSLPKVVL